MTRREPRAQARPAASACVALVVLSLAACASGIAAAPAPSIHAPPSATTPAESRAALLPAFSAQIPDGPNEMRIENRQYFDVTVGFRDGAAGRNVDVAAGGTASLFLTDGAYAFYVVQANTPMHVRHDDRVRLGAADGKLLAIDLNTMLPPYAFELRGSREVRVRNPNEFAVEAGIRSGDGGADLWVGSNSLASLYVPDGEYDAYFVYSNDPTGLYKGDRFTLAGNGVEIRIVKSLQGNYGIQRVR